MKKLSYTTILSLSLAILLLPFCNAEDADLTYFEPSLADYAGLTAAQWLATSENRAVLTLFLTLDMCIDMPGDVIPVDLTLPSFVGRSGTVIDVYLHGLNDTDYLLIYQPNSGMAAYQAMDKEDDILVRLALQSVCDDGLYENSLDDLAEAAGAFSPAAE